MSLLQQCAKQQRVNPYITLLTYHPNIQPYDNAHDENNVSNDVADDENNVVHIRLIIERREDENITLTRNELLQNKEYLFELLISRMPLTEWGMLKVRADSIASVHSQEQNYDTTQRVLTEYANDFKLYEKQRQGRSEAHIRSTVANVQETAVGMNRHFGQAVPACLWIFKLTLPPNVLSTGMDNEMPPNEMPPIENLQIVRRHKGDWEALPALPQHIISNYVRIESQRKRVLKFSFICTVQNSKTLAFQHSSDYAVRLRAEFLACHTGRALVQPTPNRRERIQTLLRSLFDSVYKLVPDVPDDDDHDSLKFELVPKDTNLDDGYDKVNLSTAEWKSVPLFLRQLQFEHRSINADLFTAVFCAPIGEADVDPHFRRAQHMVRVFLPVYNRRTPAEHAHVLHIEYEGFLRFQEFDDGRGKLKLNP